MVITDLSVNSSSIAVCDFQTHLQMAELERNHAKHVGILCFFLALPCYARNQQSL